MCGDIHISVLRTSNDFHLRKILETWKEFRIKLEKLELRTRMFLIVLN